LYSTSRSSWRTFLVLSRNLRRITVSFSITSNGNEPS